jgi:hypothetical protein
MKKRLKCHIADKITNNKSPKENVCNSHEMWLEVIYKLVEYCTSMQSIKIYK